MDVIFFFLESRDSTADLDVVEKHSDNWKETKRKRKETEDRKSKRRKQIEGTETEMKSKVPRNLIPPIPGEKQAETGQTTHLGKNKTQKPHSVTEHPGCLSDPSALSGNCISCLILIFALRKCMCDICQLSTVMQKSNLVLIFF